MPSDVESLVARFVDADREQKVALARVSVLAGRKWQAVQELRSAGLTYKEIAGRVGMSVPGVQRIAYKPHKEGG